MPARSQAQRAYLNGKFGHGWVVQHGFDNPGKLPEHVPAKGKKRRSARVDAINHMLSTVTR